MKETRHGRFRMPSMRIIVIIAVALLGTQALLSIVATLSSFLGRFSQMFLLFLLGAVVAYVVTPLVDRAQTRVRRRSAAIAGVYVLVTIGAVVLGLLFFAPFARQAESMMRMLKPPPPESVQVLSNITAGAREIHTSLLIQQDKVSSGAALSQHEVETTKARIHALEQDVAALERDAISGSSAPAGAGFGQVHIPPSYVTPISSWLTALSSSYSSATSPPGTVSRPLLDQSVTAARNLVLVSAGTEHTVAATPVLVLGMQSRLDARGIKIDLHRQFGNIASELSKQLLSILKRLVAVVSSAGTLLVNSVLILIIAFYFLMDGRAMIGRVVAQIPQQQREGAGYFADNLDHLLGGYIRGHLLLAALSAGFAGIGSWLLGVPYAVLIAFSTFALSLVPIIGPIILIIPPVVIALVFTAMPTPLWVVLYFLVFMQVVTNVIGPRIMSSAVGIHPLEVLAATLIGFPLGGILGAFFAVPIVGFLHVVVTEAYRQLLKGGETRPSDDVRGVDHRVAEAVPSATEVRGSRP